MTPAKASKSMAQSAKTNSPDPKLRHFTDVADLYENASDELILVWVNELAELLEARRFSGLKYRTKLRVFREVAEKLLDKDELEEVERQAALRAAEETRE